ncbi:glycosyltransferase family 2 protein [Parasedimentitalea psychrophila]|uniref:Glycosyltransferase family 2 protein n=1 Tax=Parasedimentitalea psychrophila TaxID=2997337 RepID=A0A9Y2KZY9_9RHOB|nr:glycosyltransferase family 2 protein [Parasedimentitalea psychrophila]WIY24847.1 glycosyltransferase family 2 protein [Parasedimentitalea psychrophila]
MKKKFSAITKFRKWNRDRHSLQRAKRQLRTPEKPNTLGVLAIMKNETLNIEEWIRHYEWQGVGTIYLIDNGSTDDSLAKVQPWIESGLVKCISLNRPHAQLDHYWAAFRTFRIKQNCEWLLVADLDEFWICKSGHKLSDEMARFRHVDVIYANWTIFGSSGCRDHPQDLRSTLLMRQPDLEDHRFQKWICRTSEIKVKSNLQVHSIKGVCSSRTISANYIFQLNHYINQSLSFWQTVKMRRGDVIDPLFDENRSIELFNEIDSACTVKDTLLADLLPPHQRLSGPSQEQSL